MRKRRCGVKKLSFFDIPLGIFSTESWQVQMGSGCVPQIFPTFLSFMTSDSKGQLQDSEMGMDFQ